MGKGDKKTARGKRIIGTSGVSRQKKKNSYVAPIAPTKKKTETVEKAPAKKAAAKKPAAKKPAAKKTTTKKAAPKKD